VNEQEAESTKSQDQKKSERFIPSADTVLRWAQIAREIRQQVEREKFSGHPSMKVPLGPDRVGRIVWNKIYIRPKSETFHQFILDVLKTTIGKFWYEKQLLLPPENQHVIPRWFDALKELTHSSFALNHKDGDVYQLTLTGEVKELLSLADDVYRLQQVKKLPRDLIERLRSYDRFQGARYEIAIAATFLRCGFEIEWIEEKVKKHCEFIAKHKATGETIAVETKSRHRPGTLNSKGIAANPDSIRADVQGLFEKALKQNPGDKPFGIFIDVNMPHETDVDVRERKWVDDIGKMLAQYPVTTPIAPSTYTFLVVTNFAWHYRGRNAAASSEGMLFVPACAQYPLNDQRTYEALMGSLANYGMVSNDE
jgi:hypothetical protein